MIETWTCRILVMTSSIAICRARVDTMVHKGSGFISFVRVISGIGKMRDRKLRVGDYTYTSEEGYTREEKAYRGRTNRYTRPPRRL